MKRKFGSASCNVNLDLRFSFVVCFSCVSVCFLFSVWFKQHGRQWHVQRASGQCCFAGLGPPTQAIHNCSSLIQRGPHVRMKGIVWAPIRAGWKQHAQVYIKHLCTGLAGLVTIVGLTVVNMTPAVNNLR